MNQAAIDLDMNRQMFIDGETYVIADVTLDLNSPPYAPNVLSLMQWIVTFDRVFTGTAALEQTNAVVPDHTFAIGHYWLMPRSSGKSGPIWFGWVTHRMRACRAIRLSVRI